MNFCCFGSVSAAKASLSRRSMQSGRKKAITLVKLLYAVSLTPVLMQIKMCPFLRLPARAAKSFRESAKQKKVKFALFYYVVLPENVILM